MRIASTTLDYNYQDIADHTFLLPYTSRTIMSAEGYLTRNDDEFGSIASTRWNPS